MLDDPDLLGNPLVVTQHLLAARIFRKTSETTAMGTFQIRAAHQRYGDDVSKEAVAKGHGHGLMQHHYQLVDGDWKFAVLKVVCTWHEFDPRDVFPGGRSQ